MGQYKDHGDEIDHLLRERDGKLPDMDQRTALCILLDREQASVRENYRLQGWVRLLSFLNLLMFLTLVGLAVTGELK